MKRGRGSLMIQNCDVYQFRGTGKKLKYSHVARNERISHSKRIQRQTIQKPFSEEN